MEEMERTMLIVEDEPLARLGLKTTIPWEKHGIRIVGEARNGEEGFQKALELKPDIILSDLKMPRMEVRAHGDRGERRLLPPQARLQRTAHRRGAEVLLPS